MAGPDDGLTRARDTYQERGLTVGPLREHRPHTV